jgi:NADH:ubiquinone oxidoreductase subunit D
MTRIEEVEQDLTSESKKKIKKTLNQIKKTLIQIKNTLIQIMEEKLRKKNYGRT